MRYHQRAAQIIVGCVGVVLLVQATPRRSQADDSKEVQVQRETVEAARQTYQTIWKAYDRSAKTRKAADGSIEKLYFWSRRWKEGERDLAGKQAERIAALEAHHQRMKELETLANTAVRSGYAAEGDDSAVRYYRLQAELWLLQAKR